MPYTRPLLVLGLIDWPNGLEASRPVASWRSASALSAFASPADAARRAARDAVVFAVLAVQADDQFATAAAMSVVAERLRPIVSRWSGAGLSGDDLADAEADLVAEALAAMRADPSRPPAVIAQLAWHRVEALRRTARARAARQVTLSPSHDTLHQPEEPVRRTLGAIADALAAGVLTPSTAAVVWAECGVSIPAPAGCSPAAWRQRRSRARRALRAALGPGGGL